MNENKEIPVLNFDELVEYIKKNTNYEETVIERVLNLETDYMKKLGIIVMEENCE